MSASDLKSLVFAGDIEGVDEWLRGNPRPPASELSERYLGLAIARNNLELVKVLVEHGADPNHHGSLDPKHYKNYGFLTRFSNACAGASLQIVRHLHSRGAKIEGYVPGMTPLVMSVGNPEVTQFLLSKGAAKNIFFLIASGELDEVKRALVNSPELANAADEFGHTVLHYACHQLEMARLLIESGADVKGRDPRKNTPLHEVANGSRGRSLILLLVKQRADVNARNWRRVTPLHNACRRGSLTNTRALLSRGAEIDALDTNRESPIFRCVGDRREDFPDRDMLAVVRFLVAQGADVTLENRKGNTCLQKATRRPVKDYLKSLST